MRYDATKENKLYKNAEKILEKLASICENAGMDVNYRLSVSKSCGFVYGYSNISNLDFTADFDEDKLFMKLDGQGGPIHWKIESSESCMVDFAADILDLENELKKCKKKGLI